MNLQSTYKHKSRKDFLPISDNHIQRLIVDINQKIFDSHKIRILIDNNWDISQKYLVNRNKDNESIYFIATKNNDRLDINFYLDYSKVIHTITKDKSIKLDPINTILANNNLDNNQKIIQLTNLNLDNPNLILKQNTSLNKQFKEDELKYRNNPTPYIKVQKDSKLPKR